MSSVTTTSRRSESGSAWSGELWERWVDLNYRLGQDPALYGAADHLLYAGRKI